MGLQSPRQRKIDCLVKFPLVAIIDDDVSVRYVFAGALTRFMRQATEVFLLVGRNDCCGPSGQGALQIPGLVPIQVSLIDQKRAGKPIPPTQFPDRRPPSFVISIVIGPAGRILVPDRSFRLLTQGRDSELHGLGLFHLFRFPVQNANRYL